MPHDAALFAESVKQGKTPAQTKAAFDEAVAAASRAYKVDDITTVVQYRALTGQSTPAPTLSTLTPNTKVINSGEFDVVVAGTNFQRWSVVLWNGAPRPTVYTSPTSLTVTAPAVTAAGVVPVQVTSGGALISAPVNFTFTAVVGEDQSAGDGVPDMSWLKAQIVAWLQERGVDIDEEALNSLTKAELIELSEDLLTPDEE